MAEISLQVLEGIISSYPVNPPMNPQNLQKYVPFSRNLTLGKIVIPALSLALIAAPAVHAASDAWTGATDGTWATTSNWSPSVAVPGSGDTATFNGAGNGFTTLDLGAGVTLGTLLFDTSSAAAYTIGSGAVGSQTLTFGTANGGITLNSPVANGQTINANIALSNTTNYGFANYSSSLLTVAGGISASTSGAKTFFVNGAGSTTVSGAITNGTGSVVLSKNGAGTLTLSGANTYSGGTTVRGGTVAGIQTSGTPFGTGAMTLNSGTLSLAPTGSGSNVSLTGGTTAAGTLFTVSGGNNVLSLNKGSQTSLTYTFGGTGAAFSRSAGSALVITESAANTLGSATGERFIINGTVPTANTANANLVNAPVVIQTSPSDTTGDFARYDATNGFISSSTGAAYTTVNGTAPTTAAGAIWDVTGASSVTGTVSSAIAALRVGANTLTLGTGATGITLTMGNSASNTAQIILNGGTIAPATAGSATQLLAFGGSEGTIYTSAAGGTISAKMTGTNGVTTFGPGTLTLSGGNGTGLTGTYTVNAGRTIVSGATTFATATVNGGIFESAAANTATNLNVNAGQFNVTSNTLTSSNGPLVGASNFTGTVNISNGATITQTGNFFRFGNSNSSVGILNNAGTYTAGGNGGNFGNGSNSSGVLYNSGTFNGVTANAVGIYLGNNGTSSYGYVYNSGTFNQNGSSRMWVGAQGGGATGVFDVTAGTASLPAASQFLINGNGTNANAQVNITGGTASLGTAGTMGINNSTGGFSSVNISGTGKLVATGATIIDLNTTSNAANTSLLTLGNNSTASIATVGGELDVSAIKNTGSALSTGILSFNGGTLKATATDATGLIYSNVTTRVQSGGGTIDNGGFNPTVASALQAPTGNGVTGITLGGTLSGYIGAPAVKISGGGGTGATAIASFDPTTGTITGITITSPGSGYTSAPTVTLVGGDGKFNASGVAASTATAVSSIGSVSSGGMTFQGSGTTTLTGANTYTGATNVNAGTLVYSTATSTVGSVAVADVANLKLKAFSPSSSILSATSLTLGTTSGSTLTMDFNGLANPTAAPITLSGGLTINGVTLAGLNAGGLTNTNGTPFTLISAPSGITGTFTNSTVTLGTRSTAAIAYTSTAVTLDITTDSITWSGVNSSAWSGGNNWATTAGHATTDYLAGDIVKFGDTYNVGSGNTAVTNPAVSISGGNVSPASVTFNNSSVNYTISSSDSSGIAGTGPLTKNGTGTATIGTANSYSGGTTVNAGTLALSGSGTLGSTSGALAMAGGTLDLGTTSQTVGATTITAAAASGNTIQNGTLTPSSLTASNSSGNAIVAANLAGSGGVTMSGAGTLTLSGTTSYTGVTTVSAGTLALSGTHTGSGALTVNAGTLALSGTYTGGGALTVNAGATFTGTSSGTNTIGDFTVTGASSAATLTSGTYNVTETNGNNTRINNGGSLTVSGATLNISGSGGWLPIGDTASTTSTVTLNSGAINVTNGFGVEVGRIGNGVLNINGGTFTVDDTNSIGFIIGDQPTAQSGTVNLSGGVLAVRLLKSNNGTNALNFNGGTLQATSTNSGATFWASSATLTANVRNNGGTIDNNGTSIAIGQALVHSTIGGDNATDGGMTFTGSSTTTLTGANTYTGATTISAGTLALSSTGSLTSTTLSIAAGATFDVSAKSSYSLSSNTITLSLNASSIGGINAGALAVDFSSAALTLNLTTATPGSSYDYLASSLAATGNLASVTLSGSFSGTLSQSGNIWSGVSGGYAFSLDQTLGTLNVTAVPEPHEYAVAIAALLGVLIFIRRRNQQM